MKLRSLWVILYWHTLSQPSVSIEIGHISNPNLWQTHKYGYLNLSTYRPEWPIPSYPLGNSNLAFLRNPNHYPSGERQSIRQSARVPRREAQPDISAFTGSRTFVQDWQSTITDRFNSFWNRQKPVAPDVKPEKIVFKPKKEFCGDYCYAINGVEIPSDSTLRSDTGIRMKQIPYDIVNRRMNANEYSVYTDLMSQYQHQSRPDSYQRVSSRDYSDDDSRVSSAVVNMYAAQKISRIVGRIAFSQIGDNILALFGMIEGLEPNQEYEIYAFEWGNIDRGCKSIGRRFAPKTNNTFGYGYLSGYDNEYEYRVSEVRIRIRSAKNGVALINKLIINNITLFSKNAILGRSLALFKRPPESYGEAHRDLLIDNRHAIACGIVGLVSNRCNVGAYRVNANY